MTRMYLRALQYLYLFSRGGGGWRPRRPEGIRKHVEIRERERGKYQIASLFTFGAACSECANKNFRAQRSTIVNILLYLLYGVAPHKQARGRSGEGGETISSLNDLVHRRSLSDCF